ncbi:hypothetical protein [Arthrobacter sp. NPDC089319]|uniref:hypothetical protein n=1 Tax=Arthrobacter sp. NPDC089319 TaxID=3155915 RepID=UPI0034174346
MDAGLMAAMTSSARLLPRPRLSRNTSSTVKALNDGRLHDDQRFSEWEAIQDLPEADVHRNDCAV